MSNDVPRPPPSSNPQKGSIKVIQKAPTRPHREEAQVSMREVIAGAKENLTSGLLVAREIARDVFGPEVPPEVVIKVYGLFLDEIDDEGEEDADEGEEDE